MAPTCATIEQTVERNRAGCAPRSWCADLYAERITGAPYLEIETDRTAAARYGINVGDVQDVIETAIGGKNLTTAIDGRQRLPDQRAIRPRFPRNSRSSFDNVLVTAANGAQIPLGTSSDLAWSWGRR